MRIGEVADKVGVNTKTIRYYEGIGLLPDPERLPSGYRDYAEDDVNRLSFIRTAQRLGLTLSEISEILAFREREERPCEYVLGVLDRQVADLDRRMAEMAQLRHELTALKGKADRLPRDEGCYCAVIEHTRAGPARDSDVAEYEAGPDAARAARPDSAHRGPPRRATRSHRGRD